MFTNTLWGKTLNFPHQRAIGRLEGSWRGRREERTTSESVLTDGSVLFLRILDFTGMACGSRCQVQCWDANWRCPEGESRWRGPWTHWRTGSRSQVTLLSFHSCQHLRHWLLGHCWSWRSLSLFARGWENEELWFGEGWVKMVRMKGRPCPDSGPGGDNILTPVRPWIWEAVFDASCPKT